MGKCLVTKLNGVVDNSSLLKIGEMRIHISRVDSPTAETQSLCFQAAAQCKLTIIGDGYFTDSTLSENKGNTIILDNTGRKDVYVSNGDFDISIEKKYVLKDICFASFSNSVPSPFVNKAMSIDDIKYSTELQKLRISGTNVTGDCSSLDNLSKLNELKAAKSKIYGDLSVLKNKTALEFIQLFSCNVSGDLSYFQNLTNLTALQLNKTSVKGNLSSLSALTKLTYISATSVEGDVSSLNNLNALSTLQVDRSSLTGDISKLPPLVKLLNFTNNSGSSFTWTSRNTASSIISIVGSPKISNIDQMLIDEANCVAQSGTGIYRMITATGTRTSASDAAVTTLQQKGYTVSITPA